MLYMLLSVPEFQIMFDFSYIFLYFFFFFFQAEDGIRDLTVTGVQTCALPIWCRSCPSSRCDPRRRRSRRGSRSCRSEEHTSELQSQSNLVCRLLLEKKKKTAPSTFQYEMPLFLRYTQRPSIRDTSQVVIAQHR